MYAENIQSSQKYSLVMNYYTSSHVAAYGLRYVNVSNER